jgi:hypothetical protein
MQFICFTCLHVPYSTVTLLQNAQLVSIVTQYSSLPSAASYTCYFHVYETHFLRSVFFLCARAYSVHRQNDSCDRQHIVFVKHNAVLHHASI